MSNPDINAIKKLRTITGAGFMDCKKALKDSNNDIDVALDSLRKKGAASAQKKSARDAKEGIIAFVNDGKKATIIEVNSETDFVAKNKKFIEMVNTIINKAHDIEITSVENFLEKSEGINDLINNNISVIGENIKLTRASQILESGGRIFSYAHNKVSENAGKIAVLLSAEADVFDSNTEDFLKKLAMHIAASKPIAVNTHDVKDSIIKKEEEILRAQVEGIGKPQDVIEKMIKGRIAKFFETNVLMEQVFVIDGKTKIKDLIKNMNNNLKIRKYLRFEVGE